MVLYKLCFYLIVLIMLVKLLFFNIILVDFFVMFVLDMFCGNKLIFKLFINEGWFLIYSFKVKNVL